MQQWKGRPPRASDTFLQRICYALDKSPKALARAIGVDYKTELAPLLQGNRSLLAEIDRDEVWWKISEYVSKQIGSLMAIKGELNRALQNDRAKRVLRHKRFKKYHERIKTD